MAEPLTPEQWRHVKEGDLLWSVGGPVLALKGAYYHNTDPNTADGFDYWFCVDADLVRTSWYHYRRTTLSLTPVPDDW